MADVLTQEPSTPSRIPDILRRTAPWARLMSVLLFVSSGFMLIGALVLTLGMAAGALASGRGASGRGEQVAPMLVVGIGYAIVGLINIVPASLLWRFASRASEYATNASMELLERALDAQRSYWKFMGIFVIVGFVCMILVIVLAA